MPRSVSRAAARAARSSTRRELLAQSEEFADLGRLYGKSKLAALAADAAIAGRPGPHQFAKYVSQRGLAVLMKAALPALEEQGVELPYNMFPNEEWEGGYRPHYRALEAIEAAARLGGWLKAAARLPGIVRFLRKTQSGRGLNSPYTTVDLPSVIRRFPSPGRFERLLWATKERAEAVLSAYHGGLKPSWQNCANALLHDARPGKAGVIAAAAQLGFGIRKGATFRAARDWLVEHRSAAFPVADTTDGVVCRLALTPELNKLGVTVTQALVVGVAGMETGKRSFLRLVRKGERTYHCQNSHWQHGEYAMREAISAWRRQDELRLVDADFVGFLKGEVTGACPIILRCDSYAAGNCRPGTESWVSRMGWNNREFIPGVWLIPHLHDDQVRRVVAHMLPMEFLMAA